MFSILFLNKSIGSVSNTLPMSTVVRIVRFGCFSVVEAFKGVLCEVYEESGGGVVWSESVLGVSERDVRVCECIRHSLTLEGMQSHVMGL